MSFGLYWKSMSRSRQLLWILLPLLTLFRIFLFLRTPLDVMGNTPHDDLLLLTHAQSILEGNWLGTYCNTTLVKGVSFPLFVALCSWLCIPYLLGLALLYIGSILVFLRAIRPLHPGPYAKAVIYLFLLYAPSMLSKLTAQRPYNIALIPSAVLLVTGSFTGLFLRREESGGKLLAWGFLAGVSLSFFWYTREDSLWLAPFAFGAAAIGIICIFRTSLTAAKKLRKAACMLLPFLLLLGLGLAICGINQYYYRTFTTNERTHTSFAQVMSDLVQMDVPQTRGDVWVSREAMEKAMECSPTLESIRASIDGIYQSGWAVNGEISGDIIAWALRDAAADAGYFTDGSTSRQFFADVHEELSAAYEDGRLERKEGIFLSSLSDGFVFSEDFFSLMQRSLKAWKELLIFSGTEVDIFPASGSAEQIRFFETITDGTAVYPPGMAFSQDPSGTYAQRPVVHSQRILAVLRILAYPLVIASFFCYLWMTATMIRDMKKKRFDLWYRWLITTGIAGCCAILIVEVSWFTTYLGDADHITYNYCTGALPMIQLVQIFTFLAVFPRLKAWIRNRRSRNLENTGETQAASADGSKPLW